MVKILLKCVRGEVTQSVDLGHGSVRRVHHRMIVSRF